MSPIRRLVIDVLKPHSPGMVEVAESLGDHDGVSGVNVTLIEIDKEVQNIKITVEGDDVDYDAVEETVGEFGGSVHSVDQVVCGDVIVEEGPTPQD